MRLHTRLTRLENVLAPSDGFCTHAAFVRLVGDATDDERRRAETSPTCDICGLQRLVSVNVILPAKMTPEAWEAKYSMKGDEPR